MTARVTDKVKYVTPCVGGCSSCPHPWTGEITRGSPNTTVNGQAVARVGDPGTIACPHGGSFRITDGSSNTENGPRIARIGDPVKCEKCGALGKILPPTSPNVFTNQDNAGASGQQGQQKKYATVFFFGGSALTLTRVLSRVGPLERVAWPTDVVPQPLLMPTEIPMEKIGDIPKAPSGEIAPDGNPTDDAIPSDKVETPESKKPKVEKIDPMEPTDNNERLRDYWEDKRDLDRVIKGK